MTIGKCWRMSFQSCRLAIFTAKLFKSDLIFRWLAAKNSILHPNYWVVDKGIEPYSLICGRVLACRPVTIKGGILDYATQIYTISSLKSMYLYWIRGILYLIVDHFFASPHCPRSGKPAKSDIFHLLFVVSKLCVLKCSARLWDSVQPTGLLALLILKLPWNVIIHDALSYDCICPYLFILYLSRMFSSKKRKSTWNLWIRWKNSTTNPPMR